MPRQLVTLTFSFKCICEGVSGRDQRLNQWTSERFPLHQCGWASSNLLRVWTEQKGGGKMNLLSLLELRLPHFPAFGHWHSWFSTFGLRPGLAPLAPSSQAFVFVQHDNTSFLDSPTTHRIQTMGLFHLCNSIQGANSYNNSLHYLSIHLTIQLYSSIDSIALENLRTQLHSHQEVVTSAPRRRSGTDQVQNSHLLHQ